MNFEQTLNSKTLQNLPKYVQIHRFYFCLQLGHQKEKNAKTANQTAKHQIKASKRKRQGTGEIDMGRLGQRKAKIIFAEMNQTFGRCVLFMDSVETAKYF